MPTYKGNVGHLMQHWTLCELLDIAQQQRVPGLNFIDAHAMAPLARTKETLDDRRFNAVEARVQQDPGPDHGWASKYEWAWHHLEPRVGYPSSAAFVRQIWEQNYSLLLCENDRETADEIDRWLRPDEGNLCRGDWRNRFAQRLPSPADVDLLPGSLTLVSFDPDLISCHNRPRRLNRKQRRRVYPEDLREVRDQLAGLDGRVLIQLSTYTAANNPEEQVARMVYDILTPDPNGFDRIATVRVDGHKRSMVYARGLNNDQWVDQLENLSDRFDVWCP